MARRAGSARRRAKPRAEHIDRTPLSAMLHFSPAFMEPGALRLRTSITNHEATMRASHTRRERHRGARIAIFAIFTSVALGCADIGPGAEIAVAEMALEAEPSAENADELASTTADTSTDSRAVPVGVVDGGAIVLTRQGFIRGMLTNDGTEIYLGIPYAQPPVGALRFRPPQPARAWSGIRVADTFGPPCPQAPGAFPGAGPQSEDCLSLNVWAANRGSNAPVMVFIHGGSFVTGAGSRFDGRKLAESGNAIVVSINYRLGALGFISLPELDAERAGVPSGNDALRDQQLALAWVRDNIAAFGGDPTNITVFGQSAGAVMTCVQLVSPLSRTLARHFIMESGTCDSALTTATLAQARATSARVVNAFCAGRSDVVACLREIPASDLAAFLVQSSILEVGWAPVINPADPLLPRSPRDMLAAGNYNRSGSIVVGSNAREIGLFQLTGEAPSARSIAELNAVIDAVFGPASPLIKQQYTAASDAEANTTLVRLGTDAFFRCPARAFARRTSAQGTSVFLFHFEEGDAFHNYELPYVFGMPDASLGAPRLVESTRQQIQTGFTSFAATGEPRPFASTQDGIFIEALPPWPRYTAETDRHISLRSNGVAGAGLSKADCDFLGSIGVVQ
jgi:para-nitrobenzyl esterase